MPETQMVNFRVFVIQFSSYQISNATSCSVSDIIEGNRYSYISCAILCFLKRNLTHNCPTVCFPESIVMVKFPYITFENALPRSGLQLCSNTMFYETKFKLSLLSRNTELLSKHLLGFSFLLVFLQYLALFHVDTCDVSLLSIARFTQEISEYDPGYKLVPATYGTVDCI